MYVAGLSAQKDMLKRITAAAYLLTAIINGIRVLQEPIAELTPQQQASGVFNSSLHDADANKEQAFIKSIETGNYLNETRSGAESTLTAILGRESATTQREMTWDEVYFSGERLDPKLNLSQFE